MHTPMYGVTNELLKTKVEIKLSNFDSTHYTEIM